MASTPPCAWLSRLAGAWRSINVQTGDQAHRRWLRPETASTGTQDGTWQNASAVVTVAQQLCGEKRSYIISIFGAEADFLLERYNAPATAANRLRRANRSRPPAGSARAGPQTPAPGCAPATLNCNTGVARRQGCPGAYRLHHLRARSVGADHQQAIFLKRGTGWASVDGANQRMEAR